MSGIDAAVGLMVQDVITLSIAVHAFFRYVRGVRGSSRPAATLPGEGMARSMPGRMVGGLQRSGARYGSKCASQMSMPGAWRVCGQVRQERMRRGTLAALPVLLARLQDGPV